MILFPAGAIFVGFGPMGVSLFFVTCVFSPFHFGSYSILMPGPRHVRTIIAQLVYTFGGSGFAGGNGSMMIEVVVCRLRSSAILAEQ